ncbi:MAG: arginine--tRNA ligase, partial [Gemmatimonadetes bacterium]
MTRDALRTALAEILAELGADDAEIRLEQPRDPSHGDVATNVALALARRLGRPPRDIAEDIRARLEARALPGVAAVEVAGPGFLNVRLAQASVADVLSGIVRAADDFGRSDEGDGEAVLVEFVSANPTGPLHLGHGRQAALGDAIAALLDWTGWSVSREYYYNDAGA